MAFSVKQAEWFENAGHRWNFKTGAVRSGKTFADYYTIPKRIRARVGKPGLAFIFGVSKSTIERNILEPMRGIWGDQLVGSILDYDLYIGIGKSIIAAPLFVYFIKGILA